MKKYLLNLVTIMFVGFLCVNTSSCSSDKDEESFNYPMESLYGTWKISEKVIIRSSDNHVCRISMC